MCAAARLLGQGKVELAFPDRRGSVLMLAQVGAQGNDGHRFKVASTAGRPVSLHHPVPEHC